MDRICVKESRAVIVGGWLRRVVMCGKLDSFHVCPLVVHIASIAKD